MGSLVDLHIHSDRSSDGDFSPFHILKLAQGKKMKAISISDHDTVSAYPEALHLGEKNGVEVIPSLELTTGFGDREFHLLCPFVDWKSKVVKDLIKQVGRRRIGEAKERIKKLQDLGFDISLKEVQQEAGPFPPLGVTIAQVLLQKGKRQGHPFLMNYLEGENRLFAPYQFYKDYFTEGKPAAVCRRNINILDVLDILPQAGAVPVLAHPGAYFQRVKKKDLMVLKERGLQGLEVFTSYHTHKQTSRYGEMAEELELVPTVGSDFHGTIKPHIPFGSLNDGGYWMVEELKKRRP